MKIKKTGGEKPLAILMYGPDGLGKTTAASHFPRPIVLGPEIEGSDFIEGMEVDEESKSYDGVMSAIDWLLKNDHEYKTVVVDSLDHVELDIHAQIKAKYKVSNLAKASGGFGAGFKEAAEMHYSLKENLFKLRNQKNMNIFLIAHDQVKPFNNPLTEEPYDRHELKLHESNSVSPRSMWREAVDAVLFLNKAYKSANESEEGKKFRAQESEERYIYTEKTAAFDAKSRFNCPKSFVFKQDENIYDLLKSYAFQKEVNQYELALKLYNSLEKEDLVIKDFIEKNKNDKQKLIRINTKLKGMI